MMMQGISNTMARLQRWAGRTLAFWRVSLGHAQRICAPGKWVVWREGDTVKTEVIKAKGAPRDGA